MNLAAFTSWLHVHQAQALAAGGAGVVGLALIRRRRAVPTAAADPAAAAALAGGGAGVAGTAALAPYSSTVNDVYDALQPQLEALQTQLSQLAVTPETVAPSPAPAPAASPAGPRSALPWARLTTPQKRAFEGGSSIGWSNFTPAQKSWFEGQTAARAAAAAAAAPTDEHGQIRWLAQLPAASPRPAPPVRAFPAPLPALPGGAVARPDPLAAFRPPPR